MHAQTTIIQNAQELVDLIDNGLGGDETRGIAYWYNIYCKHKTFDPLEFLILTKPPQILRRCNSTHRGPHLPQTVGVHATHKYRRLY